MIATLDVTGTSAAITCSIIARRRVRATLYPNPCANSTAGGNESSRRIIGFEYNNKSRVRFGEWQRAGSPQRRMLANLFVW
jgi:hypothetical protein